MKTRVGSLGSLLSREPRFMAGASVRRAAVVALSLTLVLATLGARALALIDWDPRDLGTEPRPDQCFPDYALEGVPKVVGYPFVGNRLTIDGRPVKLVNRNQVCPGYVVALTSFQWELQPPAGSTAQLEDTDTLQPTLVPDLPGNYEVRLLPCTSGCPVAEGITIPAGPARPVSFETIDHVPAETVPLFPPSAVIPIRGPEQLTKDELAFKCKNGGAVEDPQFVTVRPWAGPRDYASSYNPDTGEVEAVEGWVPKARIANKDNPLNHDSQDFNFNLNVDGSSVHVLMACEDCDCSGCSAGTTRPFIQTEWETAIYRDAFRPSPGDRASVWGFWIHDCGHPPFNTEIHPPVGVAAQRLRAIPIPDPLPDDAVMTPEIAVGQNVYVPGVLADVWFNRFAGQMMDGGSTHLWQGEPGVGVEYACGTDPPQSEPMCPSGVVGDPSPTQFDACFHGCPIDNPYGQRQAILQPSPRERVFTFRIYLPRSPKVAMERAGFTGLPEIPLFYRVLDRSMRANEVTIARVDEGDATYLRVSLDLRDSPLAVEFLRLAAAWVYPAPDNWGLRRWRVLLNGFDVTEDGDGIWRGDGEWRLWFGVNNALAEPDRGGFDGYEWRQIVNQDIGEGSHDFGGRPFRTGPTTPDRSLGPDLLLFRPDLGPYQTIHVHASGYEDDSFWDNNLGSINQKHAQVAAPHNPANVCSDEQGLFGFRPTGCARYRLRYETQDLGPVGPALSSSALALYDAYRIDPTVPAFCGEEELCFPSRNLPARETGIIWHPQDELLEPGQASPPILETQLFRPQGIEENILIHQTPDRIYADLLALRARDPIALDRFLIDVRQAVDEALATIGPEALLDAQGLRASMPYNLWRRYFGDLPPPPPLAGANPYWMTGAGAVRTSEGRTQFTLQLHCDPLRNPNHLNVAWGKNQRFALDLIRAFDCDDPPSPLRTYRGLGSGRINGMPGAEASWSFEDGGEPGRTDHVQLVVRNEKNEVVVALDSSLPVGNLQGH